MKLCSVSKVLLVMSSVLAFISIGAEARLRRSEALNEKAFFQHNSKREMNAAEPHSIPNMKWDLVIETRSETDRRGLNDPVSSIECPAGGNPEEDIPSQTCYYGDCTCDTTTTDRREMSDGCYFCSIPDNSDITCYADDQCNESSYCNAGVCEPDDDTTSGGASSRECPEGGEPMQPCIYQQCGCAEDSERKSFVEDGGECYFCAIPDESGETCYWDGQCKSESYCNNGTCEPISTRQCPEGGGDLQSCIYEECGCPQDSERTFFTNDDGDCYYCVIPDYSSEQCYWDGQCKSESYCNGGTCEPNSTRQCPEGGSNNQSCIYEQCGCTENSERKSFPMGEGDCFYCAIPDHSSEQCYWSGQCKSDSYCNGGKCEPKS